MVFVSRFLRILLEVLVWIDEGICLCIQSPVYLLTGKMKPNAGNTVSSLCGYYAIKGHRWALISEWFIDRLFYIPHGFKLGHCRSHIEWDDVPHE
jgi:hypothetical protein